MIILRIVRFRTLKFQPRIVTSLRPHGKWGDLIVCLIPTMWCINVLVNSNFLLRLIEWQSESSLFTVRIRGKQWYWIYKFDIKDIGDIMSAGKNVGFNKWYFSTNGSLDVVDDYLRIIHLRSTNSFLKRYWSLALKSNTKPNYNHLVSTFDQIPNFNNSDWLIPNRTTLEDFSIKTRGVFIHNFTNPKTEYLKKKIFGVLNFPDIIKFKDFNHRRVVDLDNQSNLLGYIRFSDRIKLFDSVNEYKPEILSTFFKNNSLFDNFDYLIGEVPSFNTNRRTILYKMFKRFYRVTPSMFRGKDLTKLPDTRINVALHKRNSIIFDESQRWIRRGRGSTEPLKLIKKPLDADNILFGARFAQPKHSILHKSNTNNPYLVIKQKRYTLKKKISEKIFQTHVNKTDLWGTQDVKSNFFIKNNVGENAVEDLSRVYRFFKKNKVRDEMFSVVTARRMLRTQHTLVLPAHVNITAITNSYDVVHSWFIPGLGLKLDCIPGRATHHTFYADNVGFYYGQCAEICGRYHHHMPIRLCVLPYEQFLLWWHHFGLPKLLYSRRNKNYLGNVYFRKYVW